MASLTALGPARPGRAPRRRLSHELPMLGPAVATVLMLVWAGHDGGYDADTWYWGALVMLGLVVLGWRRLWISGRRLDRPLSTALVAFGLYVAWSYLSLAWSQSDGTTIEGSNRALLYLLTFAVFALAPWNRRRMCSILVMLAVGIDVIGLLMLVQMATGHGGGLFSEGRLVSPSGYFNASAALFTSGALLSIALAGQRLLPLMLRAALLALACTDLQLAILSQSRGWLFTLPVVAVAALVTLPERLRIGGLALIPLAGSGAMLPRLLDVFRAQGGSSESVPGLVHAAQVAALVGLAAAAALMIAAVLILTAESRFPALRLDRARRRRLRGLIATAAVLAFGIVVLAGTAGRPLHFISKQWRGFTHLPSTTVSGSHFTALGSGRYDFWRVSLDALASRPVGGLGQDNFADFYVPRRRTDEEPSWTHSLEMRLLAHTGVVGFGLFLWFVVVALLAAGRSIRRSEPASAGFAAAGLMPLLVWLIHGSVDWFWEIPALSGPALGLLAMAAASAPPGRRALPAAGAASARRSRPLPAWQRAGLRVVTAVALPAAVGVLAFPYLAVREISRASDTARSNQAAALQDLKLAAELNPLSATPERMAGAIALQAGLPNVAEQRFRQAIRREPDGWFSWLGDGLAASALGDPERARSDYLRAEALNSRQPAVRRALQRVYSRHPLTPGEAFNLLILVL